MCVSCSPGLRSWLVFISAPWSPGLSRATAAGSTTSRMWLNLTGAERDAAAWCEACQQRDEAGGGGLGWRGGRPGSSKAAVASAELKVDISYDAASQTDTDMKVWGRANSPTRGSSVAALWRQFRRRRSFFSGIRQQRLATLSSREWSILL